MSISNEIIRIQNGVSEQEELISQIFTTVAAKSAGGGVQSVNGKTGQVYLTSEDIPFSDGETFQQKYDAGELKGDTGPAGQSAYTAAQAGGYTGTEANFYADLAVMQGLAA